MNTSRIPIASDDVGGRTEVDRLKSFDVDAALRRARQIRHPWYRCQAISAVAEVQRSSAVAQQLLEEALAAAYDQAEPNRIVSVAYWPLRQLVSIDFPAAKAEVEKLLKIIAKEPHGLRRLYGISSIVVAVAASRELLDRVMLPFKATAKVSEGWRTERIVATVSFSLAAFDRDLALELLADRPPNRFCKAAREKILNVQ